MGMAVFVADLTPIFSTALTLRASRKGGFHNGAKGALRGEPLLKYILNAQRRTLLFRVVLIFQSGTAGTFSMRR
jgi:hypothetical protein